MADEAATPVIEKPGEEPAPAADPKAETPPAERTYTKAEFEDEVKRRLASQKAAIESQQERDRKAKEEQALAQQGEYQRLAEERQQRITELEAQNTALAGVSSQRDRYKASLGAVLTKQREGLPAHITALLDRMDEAEQLEYLAANRDVLVPADTRNGVRVPATPAAATPGALTEAELQRRRDLIAQQARRGF